MVGLFICGSRDNHYNAHPEAFFYRCVSVYFYTYWWVQPFKKNGIALRMSRIFYRHKLEWDSCREDRYFVEYNQLSIFEWQQHFCHFDVTFSVFCFFRNEINKMIETTKIYFPETKVSICFFFNIQKKKSSVDYSNKISIFSEKIEFPEFFLRILPLAGNELLLNWLLLLFFSIFEKQLSLQLTALAALEKLLFVARNQPEATNCGIWYYKRR